MEKKWTFALEIYNRESGAYATHLRRGTTLRLSKRKHLTVSAIHVYESLKQVQVFAHPKEVQS
jgi:hypothetical protein